MGTVNVGIIGFGRFGRALAELCGEAGLQVRAVDPQAEVPIEWRSASVEALVASAEVLVLAAPIPALDSVLRTIAPLVRADQLVLDVSSVKVRPVALMAERLPSHAKWVGTHPLFGPASLARSDRPLRAVVCPNPAQPEATAQAEAFFTRLGCEVLLQTPEVHDRAMAQTHALTFFIARALVDLGVGANLVFTPPSFQAIAKTIELVRVDAGHLFTSISVSNPFAKEVREAFLAALHASHDALARSGTPSEPPLDIPALETQSASLKEAREQIDELDRELVSLLARRAELARQAGRAKRELGHPIQDPTREAAVLAARREWARRAGLDESQLEAVFREILTLSRRTQAGS